MSWRPRPGRSHGRDVRVRVRASPGGIPLALCASSIRPPGKIYTRPTDVQSSQHPGPYSGDAFLAHGVLIPLSTGRHAATPQEGRHMDRHDNESGRIGYLVLYLMGVPVGLLILLWVLLGNNIFGPG